MAWAVLFLFLAVSTVAADQGDNFANNLVSDLAP